MSLNDIQDLQDGTAVRVRERLPGISPSHMCSRCPTFFCARDRYFLTARHEETVHGITVWPHRQARVRIELTDDGLLFAFADTLWALLLHTEVPMLLEDHFWGHGRRDMISWSRRRGFSIRLIPDGDGKAAVHVDPPGPHFSLLVAKTWAQENMLRSADQTVTALHELGTDPVVFGPSEVAS
jgi:hypothetical protein